MRIARYLVGKPRLVWRFDMQGSVGVVEAFSDGNWAGCRTSRKSTSGGSLMLGCHTIKHWSSTQTSVALSSGEAEFAGVIRGAGQGLGYQALLKDLGIIAPLRVWTDSSAAIGICSRQGLGKLRHLDTHTLWIQQAVRTGKVDLRKVLGEVIPADLFTKYSLSRERLKGLVTLYDCHFRTGRAESAPKMRTEMADKKALSDADLATVGERLIFPHLEYAKPKLDRLYPPLAVPGAVDAGDPQ